MRRHAAALPGAIALLVALPWFTLRREPAPAPSPPAGEQPLRPAPAAAMDEVLARAPFGPRDSSLAEEERAASDPDEDGGEPDRDAPPQIVGIVGRLPDHAIVLVRRPTGGTRTLGPGESFGRWRLMSIAADAVLFGDGARRVRVELPVGDASQ